jgi:hypothetical protein
VIQPFARRQRTPQRATVARIVSLLTRVIVGSSVKATSAANSRVQTLVGWPNSRGDRCTRARNRSAPAVATGWTRIAAEEPAGPRAEGATS